MIRVSSSAARGPRGRARRDRARRARPSPARESASEAPVRVVHDPRVGLEAREEGRLLARGEPLVPARARIGVEDDREHDRVVDDARASRGGRFVEQPALRAVEPSWVRRSWFRGNRSTPLEPIVLRKSKSSLPSRLPEPSKSTFPPLVAPHSALISWPALRAVAKPTVALVAPITAVCPPLRRPYPRSPPYRAA